jgi:hypothetical protein
VSDKAQPAGPDYLKLEGGELLQAMGDDAYRWAGGFRAYALEIQRHGKNPLDEGFLIAWFANAIEHSSDVRRWRAEKAAKGDTTIEVPATIFMQAVMEKDSDWDAGEKSGLNGMWAQWSGGARPASLRNDTLVDVQTSDLKYYYGTAAGGLNWLGEKHIIAWRFHIEGVRTPACPEHLRRKDLRKLEPDEIWTEWHGGCSPVPSAVLVNVGYRDGIESLKGVRAGDIRWSRNNNETDVVRWRRHVERAVDPAKPVMPMAGTMDWRRCPVERDTLVEVRLRDRRDQHHRPRSDIIAGSTRRSVTTSWRGDREMRPSGRMALCRMPPRASWCTARCAASAMTRAAARVQTGAPCLSPPASCWTWRWRTSSGR